MYGLLIEAIVHYIKQAYGENTWLDVRRLANIQQVSFATHERYSENLVPNIAKATSHITGVEYDELMDTFGVTFVSFVGQYGYDRILKVLGRHMTDFLNGLDNLHEYLRFSYPKLRPPSFFVEEESETGLTLHYRSKRKGYVHYVKGQIRQVGKMFYNTKVDIDIVSVQETDNMNHVVMKLLFDNTAYVENMKKKNDFADQMPLSSDVFFELFPFHIVFDEDMIIRSAGEGLKAVMPELVGQKLTDMFTIVLPLIHFTWHSILAHTNNAFELLSTIAVSRPNRDMECPFSKINGEKADEGSEWNNNKSPTEQEEQDVGYALHLKGQMMYMNEWQSIIFLGTPIMESLDIMFKTGLYINDLSMHDSSRDLVLAGTQQSAELKLALDQEQKKSKILQESMLKLDAEMKRTDSLLYQMIPKPVADRLRRGEPAISTCEVFDAVTILFSDVVGFTRICSQISPMEVVSMLNAMYTQFDQLSEKHEVYKVETIGDAYMVVSGAPDRTKYHALHICDMALDMVQAMTGLRDPSSKGNMKIRVGVHSGTAVAGVVGIKMPRYCLFGDTVNTASRMETNGQAMKIHVSETTRTELLDYPYAVSERSTIAVKGKGSMKTYWLLGKETGMQEHEVPSCPFGSILLEELSKVKGREDLEASRNFRNDDFETTRNIKNTVSIIETPPPPSEHRPVYSPVSFDDVKRVRSAGTSPRESPARLCVNSDLDWEKDNKNSDIAHGTREFRFNSVGANDVVAIKNRIRMNRLEPIQPNPKLYAESNYQHKVNEKMNEESSQPNNVTVKLEQLQKEQKHPNNTRPNNALYQYEEQGKSQTCCIL